MIMIAQRSDPTMSAEAFRDWRRGLGLTQAEAADRLGLGRRVVQYYETGRREGRSVEVPQTVRLACWALAQGVIDFDGRTAVGASEALVD